MNYVDALGHAYMALDSAAKGGNDDASEALEAICRLQTTYIRRNVHARMRRRPPDGPIYEDSAAAIRAHIAAAIGEQPHD